jgi:hypothetical protein
MAIKLERKSQIYSGSVFGFQSIKRFEVFTAVKIQIDVF